MLGINAPVIAAATPHRAWLPSGLRGSLRSAPPQAGHEPRVRRPRRCSRSFERMSIRFSQDQFSCWNARLERKGKSTRLSHLGNTSGVMLNSLRKGSCHVQVSRFIIIVREALLTARASESGWGPRNQPVDRPSFSPSVTCTPPCAPPVKL